MKAYKYQAPKKKRAVLTVSTSFYGDAADRFESIKSQYFPDTTNSELVRKSIDFYFERFAQSTDIRGDE